MFMIKITFQAFVEYYQFIIGKGYVSLTDDTRINVSFVVRVFCLGMYKFLIFSSTVL